MDLPDQPAHLYEYLQLAARAGFRCVAGIDEAGRGPLAGPLVVAAAHLPDGVEIDGLNDSKQLSAARREELYQVIRAHACIRTAHVVVEVAEIDRLNIYQATCKAMIAAAARLDPRPDFVFVDGLPVDGFHCPAQGVVKGDGKCAAIAAASIVAKVVRDRLMTALDGDYPGYGFAAHKGYGTAAHLEALRRLGPCSIHRRSFAPVARCLNDARQGFLEFPL